MDIQQPHIDAWSGVAEAYDALRPAPPPVLVDILMQLLRKEYPQLVVDRGEASLPWYLGYRVLAMK